MATVIVAPRSHKSKELRRHTLIYLGLMPFLVLAVFPILWMAITAIKQDADLYLVDAVPFWFRQAADAGRTSTFCFTTRPTGTGSSTRC